MSLLNLQTAVNIETNFVIAFPNQNSDIVANARAGSGGNITITAESVLGIVERNSSPSNNTNDIDADSDFGLNGTISIFTPSSDTFQRVTELKSDIVKPEQTTAQACSPGRQSTFTNYLTIKGKGGVSSAPDLPLDSQNILTNGKSSDLVSTIPAPIETSNGAIQPARGIKVNQDGSIVLTAYRTNNAGDRLTETNRNCG